MRTFTQCDIFTHQAGLGRAVCLDRKILQITCVMPLWVVKAMLLALGVEVRPGRLEIWRFARRILMEVSDMFSGRKALQIQRDFDARALVHDRSGSDRLTLGVFNIDNLLFCGGHVDYEPS